MMPRPNPLRARLRQGPALGLWNSIGHPFPAEVLGQSGIDAVLIDGEHGAFTIDSLVPNLIAVRATPAAALVRVPSDDPAMIKRVLDIGAEGILVPGIDTVEQARAAIAACRYPPTGTRGSALGITRAGGYGAAIDAYLEPDCQPMIMLQSESAKAVENVAAIAALDGLEMLFIGPQDLSGSMGRPRAYDDAAVRDAILGVERSVKDKGVWLGSILSLARSMPEMLAAGVDFLCADADLGLIRKGAASLKSQWDDCL
jgi:2-keto-3-deoxy-L-rhamnonate aldolase RhmA